MLQNQIVINQTILVQVQNTNDALRKFMSKLKQKMNIKFEQSLEILCRKLQTH